MQTPRISAIAAIGSNRELGKNGDLIWKFDADFQRLKSIVKNKPLIMGRKTYESIGIELPYAPSIVITRKTDYQSPFVPTKHTTLVSSLEQAIAIASKHDTEEVIIFGGAGIYTEALPITQRLYLTKIQATDAAADTFFPDYSDFTKIIESHTVIENRVSLTFTTLEQPQVTHKIA